MKESTKSNVQVRKLKKKFNMNVKVGANNFNMNGNRC